MEKHYDVGIYGWWGHENFGGCLTYFALERTIKSLGYSVIMIQEALGYPGRYVIPDHGIAMQFAKKQYNCSPQVDVNDLSKFNKICDIFMVGGDQLWNNRIVFSKEDSFLSFAENSKTKLSYSTSFGSADFNPPQSFLEATKPLLKRFDGVSVREDYAVEIAKKFYNVDATQVIDAVFLPDLQEYRLAANDADVQLPKNKYLAAFILNPTEAKRKQIEQIAKKLELEVVCIPDAAVAYHQSFNEVFKGMKILSPLSVSNFLKTYDNASYIITDSFHGTCMSYIFRKPFSVYFNKARGVDRFISLMNILDLNSRRIYEEQSEEQLRANDQIDFNIDWTSADNNVSREKAFSLDWLKNTLRLKENKEISDKTVYSLSEQLCVGCGACASICPHNAISLQPDTLGYFRANIDKNKCTLCGACKIVCPALKQPKKDNSVSPKLIGFQAKDKELLQKSSTAGVFGLLAKDILSKGGVVCGAAWNSKLGVEHIIIDNEKDLYKLQKSKYMQSYMGNIFKEIKQYLTKGVPVLFSGCPCQVAGLKSYLNKDYKNLFYIDLLCGNSPSQMFFKKYLESSFKNKKVIEYEFRNKTFGWNWYSVSVTYENGEKEVINSATKDAYQSVYHNHTMCPIHCQNCKYQAKPRYGDLTIGDFWGISQKDKTMDYSKGLNAVLINNNKGETRLKSIDRQQIEIYKEFPLEYLGGNGIINGGGLSVSKDRDSFYRNIPYKTFEETLNIIAKSRLTSDTISKPKNNSLTPLGFYSSRNHFYFDPNNFEEHRINGYSVLTVKPGKDKVGIRAYLLLNSVLDINAEYKFSARFKIVTQTNDVNFHICTADDKFQVIKTVKVTHKPDFIEAEGVFKPKIPQCDRLMVGACHIAGAGAYLMVDYLVIEKI